jgi:hypothetical protein
MFKQYLLIVCLAALAQANPFEAHWRDGKAELSSYRVKALRYGELRDGMRMMLWIPDFLRMDTLVKPEVPGKTPREFLSMKLIDIVDFNTGIYPYHLATTSYMALEDKGPHRKGEIAKLTFAATEYCGVVAERLINRGDHLENTLWSYFESEADRFLKLQKGPGSQVEDNLWTWIRELQGETVPVGKPVQVPLLPSAWNRRSAHVTATFQSATISKEEAGRQSTRLGKVDAWRVTWAYGSYRNAVLVEKAYPHRILSWKDSLGQEGVLLRTVRETYWVMQGNKFLGEREKFGYPLF